VTGISPQFRSSSGLPLGTGRGTHSRSQSLCREGPTGVGDPETFRSRNDRISPSIPETRGSVANAYLAPPDPHRWRTRRRFRYCRHLRPNGWRKMTSPKLFVTQSLEQFLRGRRGHFVVLGKIKTEVSVAGVHFIQEDSGEKIGLALAEWMKTALGAKGSSASA